MTTPCLCPTDRCSWHKPPLVLLCLQCRSLCPPDLVRLELVLVDPEPREGEAGGEVEGLEARRVHVEGLEVVGPGQLEVHAVLEVQVMRLPAQAPDLRVIKGAR